MLKNILKRIYLEQIIELIKYLDKKYKKELQNSSRNNLKMNNYELTYKLFDLILKLTFLNTIMCHYQFMFYNMNIYFRLIKYYFITKKDNWNAF